MTTTESYIRVEDAKTSEMLEQCNPETRDQYLADLAFLRVSEGQCIYCGVLVCQPWERISPVCYKCESP